MRLQTSRYAAHRRGVIEPSKLPLIRAQLEQERWFRLEQLAALAGELAKVGGEPARLEVTGKVRSAALCALVEIRDAIARLDDGTYGTCQICCSAVEWERLEAVPSTRLCWQCHSATQAPSTDSASTLQHLS